MGMRCLVCTHPDRAKIDEDILRGQKYNVIERNYKNISWDSIQRHAKNHLQKELMMEEAKKIWDAVTLANEILEISLGSAREARADKCYNAVGSILNNPTKICELLTKTSDDDKGETGLASMRMELKLMRPKLEDQDNR